MITSILMGGIGNQMFQYSMGLAQARRLNTGLMLDITRLGGKRPYQLDQWRVSQDTCITAIPTGRERGLPYNENINETVDGDVLEGYWQTEKYFENIKDELFDIFLLKQMSERTQKLAEQIFSYKNSVFIHIRRGDYLLEPHKSFHGVLDRDYYTNGLLQISKNYKVDHIFIFSDDVYWCQDNFRYGGMETLVVPGLEAEDIYLMRLCKHAIIANSSFSWWGAWLGDYKQNRIVIAPQKWFQSTEVDARDIVPDRWIKI